MFRRKTVFVVGAGASKELGLPTGAELSKLISTASNVEIDPYGSPTTRESRLVLEALRRRTSNDVPEINKYIRALHAIRDALPLKDSIDAVIDQFREWPEIADVGKYLIARFIANAERESALRLAPGNLGQPQLANVENTWIHTFGRMLLEGRRVTDLNSLGENIAVICFNYDRCIEHYLSHAIARNYSIDMDSAVDVAAKVRVIHAYGSLGALPGWPGFETKRTVPFGPENVDTWKLASSLKTFSESIDSDTDDAIKSVIGDAQQYVYLGLSFGRQNMELLSVGPPLGSNIERPIYASAMGQYEQSRPVLTRLLQRSYSGDFQPPVEYGDTKETHIEIGCTAKNLLDLHWHNILD